MGRFLSILSILLLTVSVAYSKEVSTDMKQIVSSVGDNPTVEGSEKIFTGKVNVETVYSTNLPSRNTGAYVTFERGARSAWHTHPAGQTLVVISGVAWTQEWNGASYEAKAGDVIYCPPDKKHWHGASPDYPMTHFSVVESIDGKNVNWLEKVTDEEYEKAGRIIAERYLKIEAESNLSKTLTARQISLVKISAFTALGDIPKLKLALNEALNSGLTINDINESLTQLYAYTGFPRSLNAISAFMEVVDSRKGNENKDKQGVEPKILGKDIDKSAYGDKVRSELSGAPTVAGWQKFAPGVELFLKEHLFADIFGRGVLTYQEREIVTVSALASLYGVNSQLGSHINMAMNTGLNEGQLRAILKVIEINLGKPFGSNATAVFNEILAKRGKK